MKLRKIMTRFKMDFNTLYDDFISWLKRRNYGELRSALKRTYKRNPYTPESQDYIKWQEQCLINIPILYFASIYLHSYAKMSGYNRYLFVTRDGCHWHKIFSKMYPKADVHYFRSSRNMFDNARHNQNPDYNNYYRALASKKSLYIDVHGTGEHMLLYCDTNGLPSLPCFFLTCGAKRYEELPIRALQLYREGKFHSLVFDVNGSPIEMLNYDTIGSLRDYTKHGPVLADLEYDSKIIQPYHNCVNTFLEHLSGIDSVKMESIPKILKDLIEPIENSDQKPCIAQQITHLRTHPK